MKNWKTLVLILSLFAQQNSFASSCKDVRLDRDAGPLTGILMNDQGDNLPGCYAFSSTVLLSAYLKKIHPETKLTNISPEFLWSHILAQPPEEIARILSATNGRTCGAANLFTKDGGCTREAYLQLFTPYAKKKSFLSFTVDSDDVEQSFIPFREMMLAEFNKDKSLSPNALQQQVTEKLKRYNMLLPGSPWSDAIHTIQTNAPSAEENFDSLLSAACKAANGTIPALSTAEAPLCTNFGFTPNSSDNSQQQLVSPDTFKEKIHSLLEQPVDKVAPVGIEYCSGILRNDESKSYITNRNFPLNIDYLNTDQSIKNLDSACDFHASSIIGEKKGDDEQCYFLIQNSWGSDCSQYANPSNCEDGKIWVEENDLSENILRLVNLSESGEP